ncbi:transcription initiation factor iib [Vairimorpha apis BRL 01]|uniref:Transcription initiation factor IIB n=1 Tax=Vairimorpha apis BRL 01 TaxID=1037528 RepID=T0L9D1_9MICR|nr:transcription initiation factor iib [Vairimorpha apis BRL 01]
MSSLIKIRSYTQKCDDCGEKENIIEDYRSGYNVCGTCGCVVGNRIIDESSEWRSFSDSNKADPCRTGSVSNPFVDVEQLDTMISTVPGGNSYNLQKIQLKTAMRGPERTLKHGINLITAYCERANITKTIIDRASYIFKIVDEKKLLKGKNIEGVVGACIYIACKLEGCSRTFKEISIITSVQKREIGRSYKLISPHIDNLKMMSTEDIVSRFCSDLRLNIKIQRLAAEISRKVQEASILAGKSPDSIAAAIIYLVTNLIPEEKKVQKDIQNVTNVTEVTIKNTYKELVLYKTQIIPIGFVTQESIDKLPNY